MNGICLIWSRGRLISPSLPVSDDRYLNLSSQKRPTGRNLGRNRLVRRSGTTSRGTVVLMFCLRMRRLPLTLALTIFVGMICNYPPKGRWIVVDLYISTALHRSCKLPPSLTVFPCQPIETWLKFKLLTTLITEICGLRAFHTARTAKHFRKFVRIVTQAKKKVYQLPAQKYKNPNTHSCFLQCVLIL